MAHWLTIATKALARRQEPVAEPFDVLCECGRRHAGLRNAVAQRLLCEDCGSLLFVLPRNVYPVPASKRKGPPKPARKPAKAAPTQKPQTTPTRQRSLRNWLPRPDVRGWTARGWSWSRRQVTPLRLVVLAIVCAITLTGLWVQHETRLDKARSTLQVAAAKGRAAFADGDFRTAQRELEAAVAALDLLRLTDSAALEIRQLAREAAAANGLLDTPLLSVLREAITSQAAGEDWSKQFGRFHSDGWIVLDAPLVSTADATGRRRREIEFPLTVEGRPVRIIADLPIFNAAAPQRVILAAQMAECRLVRGDEESLEVRLRPETAFLWSDFDSYLALGFRPDDLRTEEQTRMLLDEQRRIMEESP